MSWPVTLFTCSVCDFGRAEFMTRGEKEYVLPNGIRLPVRDLLGWCEDCRTLVQVESLSETICLGDIQRAEETLAANSVPYFENAAQMFGLSPSPRELPRRPLSEAERFNLHCGIDDARDLLALVRARRTPPRCLECGSDRIHTAIMTNSEPWSNKAQPWPTGFHHPGCGGEIQMVAHDGLWIDPKLTVRRYTPHGDLIEEQKFRLDDVDTRTLANARLRGRAVPE